MSNETNTTETITYPKATPQTPPALVKKIGKTTAPIRSITANEWLVRMIPQMAKAAEATEELKARDQMAWVGLINNCKARVEEIICNDLIYG